MRHSLSLLLLLLISDSVNAAPTDTIKPFVTGSFATILAAHQGQQTIISFWSPDCPPCIEEMPLWKTLRRTHPELAIVLVTTEPLSTSTRSRAILKRFELTDIEAWAFADPVIERLRFDIDRQWFGELPRTYLLNAANKLSAVSGLLPEGWLQRWTEYSSHSEQ